MTGTIRIAMFGGLCVYYGEKFIARFPAQQNGVLLALLALNLHRPCTREELASALWPEVDLDKGRRNLRQTLFKLKQQMRGYAARQDELFLQTPDTIRLAPGRITTDVLEFERAVQLAQRNQDASARVTHLRHAETLYQGELLPGFYVEQIIAEQHRLDCLYQSVLHELVLALLEIGESADAAKIAMRALDRDPISEEAHSDLMRVYAVQEQPLAIQRQYQELERLLQEALDEQPSQQTRDLARKLQAEAGNRIPQTLIRGATPIVDASVTLSAAMQERELPPARPALPETEAPPPEVSAPVAPLLDSPVHVEAKPRKGQFQRLGAVGLAIVALLGVAILSIYPRYHRLTASHSDSPRQQPGMPAPPVRMEPQSLPSPLANKVAPYSHATPQPRIRSLGFRWWWDATGTENILPPLVKGWGGEGPKLGRKSGVRKPPLPGGQQLFVQRIGLEPGDRGNDATDVIVDPTGGVFVLGFVYSPKTDVDFLIVKYSAKGKKQWERRYDGPGHDMDRARSGAVDANGNLYVTGESDGGKGDGKGNHNALDVATMKFDKNGTRLWVQRWAGPGNNADEPVKLCLDTNRNVYVTARSNFGDAPESGFDWITLKYDANGILQWCQRFGTPGDDEPTDMVVDSAGNVYVVGYVQPSVSQCNVAIVKYTALGKQAWVRIQDWRSSSERTVSVSSRPVGVVLGDDNALYIAGTVCHSIDVEEHRSNSMILGKYDPQGHEIWRTGRSLGGGPQGTTISLVTNRFGQIAVTATLHSNVHTTDNDILTQVYDARGNLSWERIIDGAAHTGDQSIGIVADAEGNFIVAGTVNNGINMAWHTREDYVTAKYAPDGTERWRRCFNGGQYTEDFARVITVDRQSNVYVVGQSNPGSTQPLSVVTVKYSP